MTEAEKQMHVLEGEPITITLFGKPKEVRRLSIAGQRRAVRVLTADAKDGIADEDAGDFLIDKMFSIVSLATEISEDELNEKSSLVEIMAAFEAVYNQNEIRFLLQTMVRVTQGASAGK